MKKGPKIFAVIMLLAGISFLLYPYVSNLISEYRQKQIIETYIGTVKTVSEEQHSGLFDDAQKYNEELYTQQKKGVFREEGLENYNNILKIDNTGVMGYVEIPSIDVRLPIYHGTDDVILQAGAGHSGYTSIPIGGKNTHAMLFGHSALPQSKLFTDLEMLQLGDYFNIGVLRKKLNYKIIKIEVVKPNELVDRLAIEEGRDLVTLVTCTPYGVNSHRLVITGERTEDDVEKITKELIVRQEKKYHNIELLLCIAITTTVVALLTIIAVIVWKKRRRTKTKA